MNLRIPRTALTAVLACAFLAMGAAPALAHPTETLERAKEDAIDLVASETNETRETAIDTARFARSRATEGIAFAKATLRSTAVFARETAEETAPFAREVAEGSIASASEAARGAAGIATRAGVETRAWAEAGCYAEQDEVLARRASETRAAIAQERDASRERAGRILSGEEDPVKTAEGAAADAWALASNPDPLFELVGGAPGNLLDAAGAVVADLTPDVLVLQGFAEQKRALCALDARRAELGDLPQPPNVFGLIFGSGGDE